MKPHHRMYLAAGMILLIVIGMSMPHDETEQLDVFDYMFWGAAIFLLTVVLLRAVRDIVPPRERPEHPIERRHHEVHGGRR